MEQITREEMIGLLQQSRNSVDYHQGAQNLNIEAGQKHFARFAELLARIDSAIAALQSAEPVAHRYRFADPISGHPVWRFSPGIWNGQRPKESQPLFSLPRPPVVSCQLYGHEVEGCGECSPPDKAQVPEEIIPKDVPAYLWAPESRSGYAMGWNACRKAMLTASPAKSQGEIAEVLKEMRARKINHGKNTSPTLEAWRTGSKPPSPSHHLPAGGSIAMFDTCTANEIATLIADGKYKAAQDVWQTKAASMNAEQLRSLKDDIEQIERDIRASRKQPQGGEND